MDKAYRLLPSGEKELVDEAWLNATDRMEARKHKYVCTVENCGIALFPVYPTAPLKISKKPRVRHFAPRGETHKNHGGSAANGTTAETTATTQSHADGIPTHWRPRQSVASSPSKNSKVSGTGNDTASTSKGPRRNAKNNPLVTTGQLSKLVSAWREHQPHIRSREINGFLSGRERWDHVFKAVDDPSVPTLHNMSGTRVWFGPLREIQPFGKHHFKLFFKPTTQDGLNVSCYLIFPNEEQNQHPAILATFNAVSAGKNVNAYLLGTAKRLAKQLQIEIDDFRSLVVVQENDA